MREAVSRSMRRILADALAGILEGLMLIRSAQKLLSLSNSSTCIAGCKCWACVLNPGVFMVPNPPMFCPTESWGANFETMLTSNNPSISDSIINS